MLHEDALLSVMAFTQGLTARLTNTTTPTHKESVMSTISRRGSNVSEVLEFVGKRAVKKGQHCKHQGQVFYISDE